MYFIQMSYTETRMRSLQKGVDRGGRKVSCGDLTPPIFLACFAFVYHKV